MRRIVVSLAMLAALGVGACASGDHAADDHPSTDSGGVDATTDAFVSDGDADVADDLDSGVVDDTYVAPTDDGPIDTKPPPPVDTAVYAHSDTRLYRLDAVTLAVTEIGEFQLPGGGTLVGMTDIALDKDANMIGISFGAVYTIDYKAAGGPLCTQIATLDGEFNGLTYVPAGTIDPLKEVLVGVALDGGWWRIDVAPGATAATTTKLGSYGGGLTSSGDVVGIIGDRVYATVEGTSGPGDHVIVVDPKVGTKLTDLGDTLVPGFWGVGYWGGTMYGFKSDGRIYSIDLATAKATEIVGTTKPDNGWWGAGVRTSAPNTPTK